jgi:hypothetical protein
MLPGAFDPTGLLPYALLASTGARLRGAKGGGIALMTMVGIDEGLALLHEKQIDVAFRFDAAYGLATGFGDHLSHEAAVAVGGLR